LTFGASDPQITITAITSPSCGYCQAPFLAYRKLLDLYPTTLQLQVVFSVPYSHNDNIATKVASTIATMYIKQSEDAYQAALAWYKDRNESAWLEEYGATPMDEKVPKQLEESMNWCKVNNFRGTPVTLLNGYEIPKIYDITDLHWLLTDYQAQHVLEET
uniref:DsbA family protein n=1 Tax=Fulvivirga sp. TaxID=1931237 RepID=UPI00404B3F33